MNRLREEFCFTKMLEVITMDASSTYLFRELTEGQINRILAAGKEIYMKKEQQIIREGQAANGVY